MTHKRSYAVLLATIAATTLIESGAASINQQGHSGMLLSDRQSQGKMSEHQPGMMDMSAMKQEPHHLLAMAYKDNLVNFANALRQEAAESKTVDAGFARAVVAEMKRDLNQMRRHHQDHMKTMDEPMKVHMADMMKQMDAHHSAIQEHLTALDRDVHTSAPDAKSISMHVAGILEHCDGMSGMRTGTMEHEMAGPKDRKTD
jgi:hypothetical protein